MSGNTRGRYKKKRSWENTTDEPVPKYKKVIARPNNHLYSKVDSCYNFPILIGIQNYAALDLLNR